VEACVTLEPGTLLLLYSDGLIERRGERLSVGLARLAEAASALRDEPVDEICERVLGEMRNGSDQNDDIVLIGLRTLPVARRAFHRAFPARPEELRHTRTAMRSWFKEQGLDPGEEYDLLLTVGEACSNAVEHAYHGRGAGNVEVEIVRENGGVVARVKDFGRWREPTVDANRGRGTGIMQALSDRVAVDTGPAGTTVTITFAQSGVEAA
jgi:anti-sigma regulatory factor (Ser/Thr protein kinase)